MSSTKMNIRFDKMAYSLRIGNRTLSLSGSALKFIALISMVIDHWALFFVSPESTAYSVMRCLGRIAFPVFAFLISEGFIHTRNRKRYFLTLLFFAFISEIPWFFIFRQSGTHNVLFTLTLGVVALALIERLRGYWPLCVLGVLIMCGIGYLLRSDYNWRGVLMIVLFYVLRPENVQTWKERFGIGDLPRGFIQVLFTFPLMMRSGIIGAVLASIVILLYDARPGRLRGPVAKYSFYAFYPLHLGLFYLYYILYIL